MMIEELPFADDEELVEMPPSASERRLADLMELIKKQPWKNLLDWSSTYVGFGCLWVYSKYCRHEEYLMVVDVPTTTTLMSRDSRSRENVLTDKNDILNVIEEYVVELSKNRSQQ